MTGYPVPTVCKRLILFMVCASIFHPRADAVFSLSLAFFFSLLLRFTCFNSCKIDNTNLNLYQSLKIVSLLSYLSIWIDSKSILMKIHQTHMKLQA